VAFQSVTERAELYLIRFAVLAALALAVACRAPLRVDGVYSHDARVLVRLDTDYNGDGRIDARTYMRNGHPIRVEADGDRDGVVDRWEYYGASGALIRIGGSTRADGVEDTWVHVKGDERIVEIATKRDGMSDRREIYRGQTLVQVITDTDRDGNADRWEDIEHGRVARVSIDDSSSHQGPTRRIVYRSGAEPRIDVVVPEETHAAR
jgi:hypothetical protein